MTTSVSSEIPASAFTSSAGSGSPGAEKSVETSTFRAGMWPWRGRTARRLTGELLWMADVDEGERGIVQASSQLVQCRNASSRGSSSTRDLSRTTAPSSCSLPRGEAAGEHRDVRVSGQLDRLKRGGGGDAASLVVEHEPLVAGYSVPAESQPHLTGERFDDVGARELAGRADHERDRARQWPRA